MKCYLTSVQICTLICRLFPLPTVINQHLSTLTGTRLITCSFTFYHMITHMILSFLSYYLRLSLLSLIYIPMESSRISITPYDDTLFIVLTCSTLIPTYAKSS
jgi:hypothetical protein